MRCTPFLLVPRRCDRFREVFGPKLALLNPFADRVVKPSNNQRKNRPKKKKKNIEKKRKRQKTHKKSETETEQGERGRERTMAIRALLFCLTLRPAAVPDLLIYVAPRFMALLFYDPTTNERAQKTQRKEGRSVF